MKHISARLFLAVLTFFTGITLTALWMLYREVPNVPIPKSEIMRASNFGYDSQISLAGKKSWEKEILKRFKEMPLEKLLVSVDETYRLVLLPTFDAPVSIRFWRSGDEYFLVAKKLNGLGGYGESKLGKLSYEKTQPLTKSEWLNFLELLNQSLFWDMPTLDKNDEPVPDGASWVIESNKDGIYHEVRRITPSKEFRASCGYLLSLSGLEAEYKDY
jgi:hypothetical protein